MLDKLGIVGVIGIVVTIGGLGVVGWRDPVLAAGLALVVVGAGLVVAGLVRNLLASFGMGGLL